MRPTQAQRRKEDLSSCPVFFRHGSNLGDSSVGRTFLSAAGPGGGQECPPYPQAVTRFAPSLNRAVQPIQESPVPDRFRGDGDGSSFLMSNSGGRDGDGRGVSKKLPPTATYCHFLAHSAQSLKRFKSQHGLPLRLCMPRPMPRRSGVPFVPQRMQHRLASAELGGTWLSCLCGTAQEEVTVRVG